MFKLPTQYTQPGYDFNAAIEPVPLSLQNYKNPGMTGFTGESWVKRAAKFSNYGQAPLQSTVTEFESNQSVIFTRVLYPWIEDTTHFQMQPGMLSFNIKNDNNKINIYCAAPIYKINEILRKDYDETTNELVKKLVDGEDYLYTEEGEKLAYKSSENFRYSRRGIMETILFDGCVESKSESAEPNAWLDHHEHTEMVTSAGIIVGKQARVSNIWGAVRPGDKLYLILRKTKQDGHYHFTTYFHKNKYPNEHYIDTKGKRQPAGVIFVGTCTEVKEKDPSPLKVHEAIDSQSSLRAFEAHGCLPFIQVQLRL